jgi:geranylgeranyl diphosphate synthase type 3
MEQKAWSEENDKIICGPYAYLRKVPGKDVRPRLIAAFNAVLKVPNDKLEIISDVIEMLHTASLM